jgi:hypothetical protein
VVVSGVKLQGVHQTAKFPESLAIGLCIRNFPICQEKGVLRRGLCATHYKCMCISESKTAKVIQIKTEKIIK